MERAEEYFFPFVDINECENGVAKCSQDCENTQGSYRCKCRPGYKFAHDNSSCTG